MSAQGVILRRAKNRASRGDVDSALDVIYDYTDTAFSEGRFSDVDELLELDTVDVQALRTDLLIGLLVSTYPARYRLKEWVVFYDKVKAQLIQRSGAGKAAELLAGLHKPF